MRIVVHGQQAFGKAVLEALLKRGENVVAVYVAPEKPGQKADPMKETALAAKLPLYQPASYRKPEVWEEFRALKPDLLFRLDGHRLTLSPLRGHRHEVAALAHELARGLGLAGLTPDAAERLQASRWPGNVRQLEMLFRVAAASLGPGARIGVSDLEGIGPMLEDDQASPDSGLRGERLAGERRALQRALETHHGNVAAAARSLSMSRQGFYKALRRTGLM